MNDQQAQYANDLLAQKDQNVYNFLLQLVQEKYGDDSTLEFINQEADKLYINFATNLVAFFDPMLDAGQKQQFTQLTQTGASQDDLMKFLLENVKDLEMKMLQVLMKFRQDYLAAPKG